MQQIGRYRIRGEIARGGQGAIYDAWDPAHERRVALKVLRTDRASRTALPRMLREGELLSRLRHPGLIPCYEVGELPGGLFLALGYVEGRSLGETLKTRGPLPLDRALSIADELAGILTYVHAQGLIHRDLKPDNVLLTPAGRVVLADFGLARLLDPDGGASLTRTGAALGTPGYWAPEQFRGRKHDVGPPTDVYGWAATVYALLSGQAPRHATSLHALAATFDGPPPSLRHARAEVPPWLDALLSACLAFEPGERPSLDQARGQLARGAHDAPPRPVAWAPLLAASFSLLVILGLLGWGATVALPPPAPPAPAPAPSEAANEPAPALTRWVALARERAEAGDAAGALGDYDRALEEAPSADLFVERGWLRDRLHDEARAGEDARAALALDDQHPGALALWGHLRVEHWGQLQQGLEMLEAAFAAAPDDPRVRGELASAYLDARRPADALALYPPERAQDARTLCLRGRALSGLARWDEAREALDRSLALDRSGEALLVRAQVLSQLGEDAAALEDAERARARGVVHAGLTLGRLLRRAGRHDASQAAFEAVAREATSVALVRQVVELCLEPYPRAALVAIERLEREAAAGAPVPARYLHAARHLAYRRLGDHEASLRQVDAALALGVDASLLRRRGRTLLTLEREADAADAFAQACALEPEAPENRALLARALALAGRRAEAVALLRDLRDPRPAGILCWISGRESRLRGEAAAAERTLGRAIELTDDALPRLERGLARLELGQPQAALEDFDAALALAPEEPHAWLGVARARAALGDRSGQREAAERYLAGCPWGRDRALAEALLAGD
ncbi:MAG: protein kinase [Planctomycetota bacterium]